MRHAGIRSRKQASCRAVGDVAPTAEGARAAEAVRQRVDLGRAPAARSTNCLRVLPPLTPESDGQPSQRPNASQKAPFYASGRAVGLDVPGIDRRRSDDAA